jgi:hypothetical protein
MPNVPNVPGVPNLASYAQGVVTLLVADAVAFLGGQETPQWGLFLNGAPAVVAESVTSFDYKQDWNISTYPVEAGAFASYDKVQVPFDVRLRYATGSDESARQTLLNSIARIAGTLNLYDAVMPDVFRAITPYSRQFPPVGVAPHSWVVTGHSLGGALAKLVADYLGSVAVTFGSPRVGPKDWATYSDDWLRIANRHDIVPHFPSRPPFAHIGKAIIFDGGYGFNPAIAHSLATCRKAVESWACLPDAQQID